MFLFQTSVSFSTTNESHRSCISSMLLVNPVGNSYLVMENCMVRKGNGCEHESLFC